MNQKEGKFIGRFARSFVNFKESPILVEQKQRAILAEEAKSMGFVSITGVDTGHVWVDPIDIPNGFIPRHFWVQVLDKKTGPRLQEYRIQPLPIMNNDELRETIEAVTVLYSELYAPKVGFLEFLKKFLS